MVLYFYYAISEKLVVNVMKMKLLFLKTIIRVSRQHHEPE
jgi:hypothetical protein